MCSSSVIVIGASLGTGAWVALEWVLGGTGQLIKFYVRGVWLLLEWSRQMSDKSGKCCHCICTEVQPKNGPIHNNLRDDRKLPKVVEYAARGGWYLDVRFNITGAIAQVEVL